MSLRNSFGLDFYFSENEIYLDSATAGKIPVSSLEKMNSFYYEMGGGVNRGTHNKAVTANRLLENSRAIIADVFSIEPINLSFLPSRETATINFLLSGILDKDDEIIVSSLDDHSILAPVIKLKSKMQTNVQFLSLEEESDLISSITEKKTEKTKAIFLSSMTLGIGVRRDWKEIVKVSKDLDLLSILDISNSVGHENFNFKETSPDLVISSGNIGALGPPGTAFQILSNQVSELFDPILVGGGAIISLNKSGYRLSSNTTRYEPGTSNIAGIAALANSLHSLNNIGFEKILNHEKKLRKSLVDGLRKINAIDIIEEPNLKYGPVLSFKSDTIDSHDIAIILEDLENIYVRSGALCSHLMMDELNQESLVQISTHLYNTGKDIEIFLDTLDSIMSEI